MATPFPFGSGNVLTAAQLNAITTLPINDQTASYVAVVGDVGKRIVMNVATANTVTINNSVFAAGDTIFIANKGAGATTITAGAGVTINTASSAVLAQHGGGTLVATSASVFTFFSQVSVSYGTATGGTAITAWSVSTKNYNGMKFTADGTLTVTKAGLFDVLVQSGGNGGGGGANYVFNSVGGGGSSGIQIRSTLYLSATTHTVKVGAGAAGVRNPSVAATSAQLSSIGSSIGIFGGGSGNGYGFSTGGATISTSFTALAGGTGTSGASAGGGGGAGVVGAGNNSSGSTGGAGGTGFDATDYNGNVSLGIGGGGGGSSVGGTAGLGVSGGGNGSVNAAGSNATANTGAGGGGGSTTAPFTQRLGGNGGSGIVFVRFEV